MDTISQAEALAGCEICVPTEKAADLGEGRFLVTDLIGCAVATVAGAGLGVVADVWESGGAAVLVVRREDGSGERLIPLSAAVCPVIDIAARRIEVDPPDGLLDLNEI